MRHAERGAHPRFVFIRHIEIVVAEQMADRMAEPLEHRQNHRERTEPAIDQIPEMQREWQFLLCQIRHRRLQFRDRIAVMPFPFRFRVGVLHVGEKSE